MHTTRDRLFINSADTLNISGVCDTGVVAVLHMFAGRLLKASTVNLVFIVPQAVAPPTIHGLGTKMNGWIVQAESFF